ncbi:hypothetical protein C8R46DRAFT_1053725 [Mycena filopes]|nr:hypothetical protein C8R46DRAFT_1053725 [Mycena filopes]
MSQSSKIPPTPKLGSISLPNDNDTMKIFGGTRKRLSSFLGKTSSKTNGVSRSMTPAPVPVTRYEYLQPMGYPRPRASSMTNRPPTLPEPKIIPPTISHRNTEPVRGGSSKVQYPAYMSQLAERAPGAVHPRPRPGKHEGPDTPKYMKATAKQVPLKDESIVLSWPLVPFADRRHLKYPLLYYDVAFDPQDKGNIKDNRQTHFLALPKEDQELPVSTHCKLTEIVINCPHVGSLVVERPEGLRCIDVFYAIYCKYQKKPRSHEMPTDEAKYQAAFQQRCQDCPGLPDFNRRVGFLRVDLLRGTRIFDGLRRSKHGRWELLFEAGR